LANSLRRITSSQPPGIARRTDTAHQAIIWGVQVRHPARSLKDRGPLAADRHGRPAAHCRAIAGRAPRAPGGQTVNEDDDTVCTKEACQFNDNLAGFQAAGVPVIGVSPDDAASHQRFRNKYGLQFPLLTDADHAVMEAWGAWGEKTRYGRTSVGVLRSTFLLDDQGRIERAWHNVKADGHATTVLAQLQG
jgi:thioredoxin-dependent peroxiredoxin